MHCIRKYLCNVKRQFQSPQELTKQAVVSAIKCGYRLIDTANDYDNEHVVGEALQEVFMEGVVKR